VSKIFRILLAVSCLSATAIASTTVTFDELRGYPELTVYPQEGTDLGVIFTPSGSATSIFGAATPAGLKYEEWGTGLAATPMRIEAVFSEAVSYVDLEMGAFFYTNLIDFYLFAYNGDKETDLVDWDVYPISDTDVFGMVPLHVDSARITRVVFGATAEYPYDALAVTDNFTYGVVPAPGALLLAVTGLAWVQGLRRKRII